MNILVVDDESYMRKTIAKILKDKGYAAEEAENGDTAIKKTNSKEYQIIITDVRMPGKINGIGLLKQIMEQDSEKIVIMMTAYGSVESAVDAMKIGAFDYLQKPFTPDELIIRIKKAEKELAYKKEITYLKSEKRDDTKYKMIGETTSMRVIRDSIKEISSTDYPVLITGESGTGKEIVARQIHLNSQRKDFPFIALNVSTLNPNLMESELFGHEKGAFTGADAKRVGKFEIANEGTLFLDEIGELTPDLQTRLLRVLQEKEFFRVGGNKTITTNTRIIAATNQNLEELIEKNLFREDLYYRLNVYPIKVPTLNERTGDIPLLTEHFVHKHQIRLNKSILSIDPKVYNALKNYQWHGNIRELENIVVRILIKSKGNKIRLEDLPPEFQITEGQADETLRAYSLEEITDYFLSAANRTKPDDTALMNFIETLLAKRMFNQTGEKKKASDLLGISKPTFFKWINREL